MGIVEKFFNIYANDSEAVIVIDEVNRFYLSGYDSSFGVLLLTRQKNFFITDSRYVLEARGSVYDGYEIVAKNGFSEAIEFVSSYIHDNNYTRVGYEGDTILHSQYLALKSIGVKLVSVSSELARMRAVKTEYELSQIKIAVQIAERAFSYAIKRAKPGITERDLVIELEHQANVMGAEGVSFDTIVAFGERTACPHAHPSLKRLEKGMPILVDFGVKYNHYCSDMTRVASIGEPSRQIRAIHSAVLNAQEYALSQIKAGLTGREADSFAREYLHARGLGDNFTHSLGHGVGLEIHEYPTLSRSNDEELLPNMVVTCEPGAYVKNIGGVRIEDIIVVKENGIELLNTLGKDIIIL